MAKANHSPSPLQDDKASLSHLDHLESAPSSNKYKHLSVSVAPTPLTTARTSRSTRDLRHHTMVKSHSASLPRLVLRPLLRLRGRV